MTEDPRAQEAIIAAKEFEAWYAGLEQAFQKSSLAELKYLVSSQGNDGHQIHRWYNLKESFSAQLPIWVSGWIRKHYQHTPQTVLDPFVGSGTTGVSFGLERVQVTGVEYNPFIRFVAATKAMVPQVSPADLEQAIGVLESAELCPIDFSLPDLTTFHNSEYCAPEDVRHLLSTLLSISRLNTSAPVKEMLKLGVAAAVDVSFNLRKDGRALRYVARSSRVPVSDTLQTNWKQILVDLQTYHNTHPDQNLQPLFTVYDGSATDLTALRNLNGEDIKLDDASFDTIVYSPPYLNNFDYSEVYKLELWLLSFINTYDVWKTLRLGTLRSHHSIAFPPTAHLAQDPRTQDIACHVAQMVESICLPDEERARVRPIIEGYFDDMYLVLAEQWRVLKSGGVLAYVVANSRHYWLPVATDVIIGSIARSLGFEPLDLVVLRKRNGRTRQKLFLRESAVFLRKP